MGQESSNRIKWLTIRLKSEEYDLLEKMVRKTTCHKVSEYCRMILFSEQITVLQRDSSMDEILEELIQLRRELNAVGNNLNQAMKQINSAHGFADIRTWMQLFSLINERLLPQIKVIKEQMNKYSDLWSQKLKLAKV